MKVKLKIYTKISIMLLIVGTILFVEIITVGSPLWWVPTIFYTIAAVLAWGGVAYGFWKAHKTKDDIKHEPGGIQSHTR